MNAKVHPLVAALIIAATFAAVALWTWASGRAASLGGPAELTTGPQGHRFIQIQNYLVEHDAEGSYLRTHNLDDMGVELFLGGHAFFSDGDILLRRGPDPRSFLDNLRAYKRETNRNTIVPESSDSGLFRCDLKTRDCERFGEPGVDFKAAFSVYIDQRTDEVYVSDTTRHLLRKYSSDGVELAPPVDGFHFPNQLTLHDDELLVADTNNHEISVLEPGSPIFGERIGSRDVVPPPAESAGHTWPSHFTRVGDEWWVNNMMTGMDRGGVYVFDDDWRFLRRVELPNGADPISLMAVGETVWISDWNNDVVRRVSFAGDALTDLESTGLTDVLTRSAEERRRFSLMSYAGVIVVGLLFVGLLVQAFARSMNASPVRQDVGAEPIRSTGDEPLHLEPDEAAMKRINAALRIAMVLTVLAVVPLVMLMQTSENPELVGKLIGPIAGIFAIVAMVAWVNRGNWGTAIMLDGDRLTLRDHTGRESTCSIRQVRYDDTAIATRDTVVILGRPQNRVYTDGDVREQLMPRLVDASRIGALEMLKLQIELKHPQGLITVFALVGVAIYAFVYFAT
ncbi:MAG: hypothetical protein QNJ05_01880 [Woeseiaceae bacterium]|nr:hypothetical protein [Woeseiaceae bacterium]